MDNCKIVSIKFKKFFFDLSSINDQVQVRGILNTSAIYPSDRQSFVVVFNYQLIDATAMNKEYLTFSANVFFEMTKGELFNPSLFDDEVVSKALDRLKNDLAVITDKFGFGRLPLPSNVKAPVFETIKK